jgi:CheY-like chemotaxis protein
VYSNPTPRLFVVDDEPNIAATLVTILRMNGYSARFFTRPTEALAAARQDSPDVLISDVNMPVLTGIELAVLMKARYPDLKIILLSGQMASRDLLEHTNTRGYDFPLLMKPVHPSELLLRLGKLTVMHSLEIVRSRGQGLPG